MWEGFNHLTTIPIPPCVPCPQLLSESQTNMARLVSSVSDVLDTLQKERGGARPRLKADLQRAPARGARPRGCSNGETASLPALGRGVCLRGRKNHPAWGKPCWRRDFYSAGAGREVEKEGDGKVGPGRGVLTVLLPVVHKPAQELLHTPANPSAPHRA